MSPLYIVGIDEAGRGPLAGPVAVGAVMIRQKNSRHRVLEIFPKVRDSKQLSESAREEWFEKIQMLAGEGHLTYAVSFASAKVIDRVGIVRAVHGTLGRCLRRFGCEPRKTFVLLDGGLRAPAEFINQRTIIRGDETELAIALASVVAKVSRDRKMRSFAKKYPEYGLEKHKGYGTAEHLKNIAEYGVCAIHRKTFLRT